MILLEIAVLGKIAENALTLSILQIMVLREGVGRSGDICGI